MGSGRELLGSVNMMSESLLEENLLDRKKELQEKLHEWKKNEQLWSDIAASNKSKEASVYQMKATAESRASALQSRREESDALKEEAARSEEKRFALLEFLQVESQKLVDRFSSAPKLYKIELITLDIEKLTREIEEADSIIQNECDPQIAKSESEIQYEPVTALEIPGSESTDLTAYDLEVMISKLNESTLRFIQSNEGLEQERNDLLNREESIKTHNL